MKPGRAVGHAQIPYKSLPGEKIKLPKRQKRAGYREPARATKLIKDVY